MVVGREMVRKERGGREGGRERERERERERTSLYYTVHSQTTQADLPNPFLLRNSSVTFGPN